MIKETLEKIKKLQAELSALYQSKEIRSLQISDRIWSESCYSGAGYWMDKNFDCIEESTVEIFGDGFYGPEREVGYEIPISLILELHENPEMEESIMDRIYEECRA